MAEQPLITWVHLSDIHMGPPKSSDRWDQRLVIGQLKRHLSNLPQDVPPPDLILLTGDLAFSGNGLSSKEYREVEKWLVDVASALSLTSSEIYMVPGNHDIIRSVTERDRDMRRLIRALRAGDESIDEALDSDIDGERIRSRLKSFLEFDAKFGKQRMADAGGLFWYADLQPRNSLEVRLVGLNTALLSQDDSDKGSLSLGKRQIEWLTKAEAQHLVVLLTHHPLGWLKDEKEARAWVRKTADIFLSGHTHDAESNSLRGGGGHELVEVVAGAVHATGETEPSGHRYSVQSVLQTSNGLELRVWPFKWSEENKDFRTDVDHVNEGRAYAQHVLTKWNERRLRPPRSPSRTSCREEHSETIALELGDSHRISVGDGADRIELTLTSEWQGKPILRLKYVKESDVDQTTKG